MENYPTDEADRERYSNGEKIGKDLIKDWISVKSKIIYGDFHKVVD